MIKPLGQGGMGRVYLAHDDELDRRVAIKVLNPRRTHRAAAARLQREAQAMAQLNHSGVAAVFEVGLHERRVFVAMEYIQGRTLTRWLGDAPRSRQEVLRVFGQAGRSLAIAHAGGLVHRDFKPDNVMLDGSGRVVVLDFGLARGTRLSGSDSGALLSEEPSDDSLTQLPLLGAEITQSGTVMGTPAYMAPEQHRGARADERADQFAFCVALFEALYGVRPFVGSTMPTVLDSIERGDVRTVPRGRRAPSSLHAAVLRGLKRDPPQRWPSMDALLDGLQRPRRRRRQLAVGTVVVGLAAAAVALFGDREDPCERGARRVDEVWGPQQRDAVVASMSTSAAPHAAARVVAALDGFASGWTDAYGSACNDGDRDALDRRMRCLGDRLVDLDAAARVLADGVSGVEAVRVATGVPPAASCLGAGEGTAVPSDVEQAAAVMGVRASLARARALDQAGRYADGLDVATAADDTAATLGFEPLVAETKLRLGVLQLRDGDYDAAAATLEDAFGRASALGLDGAAADAAIRLMHVYGDWGGRYEEALRWGQHAEPLVRRAASATLAGLLQNSFGSVRQRQGEYALAQDHFERALALWSTRDGPDSTAIAVLHNNLGMTHYRLGQHEQAETEYRIALETWQEAFGPRHPEVGTAHTNLGIVANLLGRSEDAVRHHEAAPSIYEASYGPMHAKVGAVANNLGLVYQRAGDSDRAQAQYQRALGVFSAVHGPDHPHVGAALVNLGECARKRGDKDASRSFHERALVVYERAYGADHAKTAGPVTSLGALALEDGDYERARALFDRAQRLIETALGPDHPRLSTVLIGVGRTRLAAGDTEGVVPPLERALKIAGAGALAPERLGEARFALAEALGTGTRARELAAQAREDYPEGSSERAEIDGWLRQRQR